MAAKKSVSKKGTKNDDAKLFAFLATFLSIVGFIIALIAKKDDRYVMFYAKQSLVIFIAYVVAAIVSIVPVIGGLVSAIVYVVTFVLWIFSWVYALSGEKKLTPIIGEYAEKINL